MRKQFFYTAALAAIMICGSWGAACAGEPGTQEPVYVVIMNHVEGDAACAAGDRVCPGSMQYQTATLPPQGSVANGSYAVDVAGNDLIYGLLMNYSDSSGRRPKLFVEPAGEWWQTYISTRYGGKAFDRYDYLSEGNEFGIQGHAIAYSGTGFGWLMSPHTAEGIGMKFRDLHYFAGQAFFDGRKINGGRTFTGGWKLEKTALGDVTAEYVIDHEAYRLGYDISFEDHDGHIRDEPPGLDNARPSYHVYRAAYDDGAEVIKLDMNGSVTGRCQGNTPRCETPREAMDRFDRTLQARSEDGNVNTVYFFGFVVHSNGVWNDFSMMANGRPLEGEGLGLTTIMDHLQQRRDSGAVIAFVTPSELAAIFTSKNPGSAAASPFGFHPAGVFRPDYPDSGFSDARNVGVAWAREGIYAYWFLIQPDLSRQEYDFSLHDEQWKRVPSGITILANIAPQGPIDEGYCLPGSYLPADIEKYAAFVKATVERYDGDGRDDMPGLTNPITYWQVGNEPSVLQGADFAELQKITYMAIKEACPDCLVLIGGVAGMPPVEAYRQQFELHYRPILDALGGRYVDIMDFHWYGNARGDYRGAKPVYDHIRSVLRADNFPDLPLWITEMGSYSGDPVAALPNRDDFSRQTEREQAVDYVRRFIYPLSFGVKKIFPAFGLMEGFKHDGGYFDHTGLIYDGLGHDDPGMGIKKLSYYSYKKMTELLKGSDWNSVEVVRDSSYVFIARFLKNENPVYAAWWDYYADPLYSRGKKKQVSITGIQGSEAGVNDVVPRFSSGAEVTDYHDAFRTETRPVIAGTVSLELGDSPVFVEIR